MMKLKPFYLVLLLALLLGESLTYGQDPLGARPKKARTPADYKPRTLKEIAAAGANLVSERERDTPAATLIDGDLFPSRVRAIYRDSARPLTLSRKDVISQWAQRYAGAPEHYTRHYTSEILFSEQGVNHWLVVKTAELPEFKKKLRRGGVVDLYLIRLGAFKSTNRWNWVLLVESFAKPKT